MTKKSAAKSKAPAAEASDKIAKGQIVERMTQRADLAMREAATAFDAALDIIVDALKSGKTVGLPGLGTFGVKATAARSGVRPGISERIEIAAGKKVGYKVASDLKSSI